MFQVGLLAVILSLTSGCALIFDDDDGNGPCVLADPPVATIPLLNPHTLRCDLFFRSPPCDGRCGPCAEPAAIPPPPIPSWGACRSSCEGLAQASCAAAPACRVVLDATCAVGGTCLTEYVGCFATDTRTDTSVDCFAIRDGETCSRNNACTALHTRPSGVTPSSEQASLPFALCVPEGRSPGTCRGAVTCSSAPPRCPAGATPGIADGCYTGACIPLAVCPPAR